MSNAKLQITNREDLLPLCPFCNAQLGEVFVKTKGLGWLEGRNVLYFCPHCHKVLGFGQSRMM